MINKLESLATTDPLTGVSNRRHFADRVTREMDMAKRLGLTNAMIMYDLDRFKGINDTYGHAAGDYILCAAVEVVKGELRSYDIIARYGGEEFVIFTPASDEDALQNIADRLCRLISETRFEFEGAVIPVTASFGAVQVHPNDSLEDALAAVDEAMYRAKKNGRNQVVIGRVNRDGE